MGFPDEDYCKNAPWKERIERRKVRVAVEMITEITVEVPSDYDDEQTEQEAKDRIRRSFADWEILELTADY